MKSIITLLVVLAFTFTKVGNASIIGINFPNRSEEVVDYEAEIRDVLESEGLEPFVVDLLVAQSKHESGNYKNSLTKYNNVFARHYHKNDTFATSAGAKAEGHSRFAKYPNLRNATLSQISYLKRKQYSFKWKSAYQFALELKSKRYYEAPIEVYTNALNKYLRKM
jgi:hypothetical protein